MFLFELTIMVISVPYGWALQLYYCNFPPLMQRCNKKSQLFGFKAVPSEKRDYAITEFNA